MVENTETISTNGHHQAAEKKEKNKTKSRIKRSKSEGKHKSSKKDLNNDRSDALWKRSADRGSSELKIQVEIKGSSSRNSRETYDQADNVDDWDEKNEPDGDENLPSRHIAKVPSRQRKCLPTTKDTIFQRTFCLGEKILINLTRARCCIIIIF
jgi:hypothetical protein